MNRLFLAALTLKSKKKTKNKTRFLPLLFPKKNKEKKNEKKIRALKNLSRPKSRLSKTKKRKNENENFNLVFQKQRSLKSLFSSRSVLFKKTGGAFHLFFYRRIVSNGGLFSTTQKRLCFCRPLISGFDDARAWCSLSIADDDDEKEEKESPRRFGGRDVI